MMIAVMVVAMMPVSVSAASKKPGRVKISSVTAGKVSKADNTYTMTIKWKKVKNATGYVIYAKHGTDGWVKQKKVSKNVRKFKLTKVPAGQTQIKIKAVNKKKSGKFSKVKTKFVKSPLTLQQYVDRVEPSAKYITYDGHPVSFAGNWMRVDVDIVNEYIKLYDLYLDDFYNSADEFLADLDEADKQSLISDLPDYAADSALFAKNMKLDTGIIGIRMMSRYVYDGKEIVSKKF